MAGLEMRAISPDPGSRQAPEGFLRRRVRAAIEKTAYTLDPNVIIGLAVEH